MSLLTGTRLCMLWLDCSSEYGGGKLDAVQNVLRLCGENPQELQVSYKWIIGVNSVRFSNVRDHDQSYQHAHVMMFLKKQRAKSVGQPPLTYAVIQTRHCPF